MQFMPTSQLAALRRHMVRMCSQPGGQQDARQTTMHGSFAHASACAGTPSQTSSKARGTGQKRGKTAWPMKHVQLGSACSAHEFWSLPACIKVSSRAL